MENPTIFLSQIIGPLFVILGLAFILNKKYYVSWFKRLDKESEGFLFAFSLIEFVAGMVIILQHNIWGSFAEILISFIGWSMVLEGALIMLVGRAYETWVLRFFRRTMGKIVMVSSLVCIALGIYMIWFGYFC